MVVREGVRTTGADCVTERDGVEGLDGVACLTGAERVGWVTLCGAERCGVDCTRDGLDRDGDACLAGAALRDELEDLLWPLPWEAEPPLSSAAITVL